MNSINSNPLTAEQQTALIQTLKARFENNLHRHTAITWHDVLKKIEANPDKLKSLYAMEYTGGEPDVVGYDAASGQYLFYDCSVESPAGRRNTCYDREGLESRKEHKPENNAVDMAASMEIELLDEAEYRYLQSLEKFDTKTSVWLKTPERIRKLGGALFGDFRYETVFIYHNGAQSYYSSRGFRGVVKV